MKSVLISIQPKWCELIASGEKTLEVRKTKPKMKTPFKCYIYCTKTFYRKGDGYFQGKYCGKVMGEFVCRGILPISVKYSDINSRIALRKFPFTCLTDRDIIDYIGNGKQGYGWHISDLVIYDKPKKLSDFKKYNRTCYYDHLGLAQPKCKDCKGCQVDRPPQSWCYVETLE